MQQKLIASVHLMRLHQPVGFLLLLWPALWGVFLASKRMPSLKIVLIFMIGAMIMRSAGCVINDIIDRKIDTTITRTQTRPLADKKISVHYAILIFIILLSIAFILSFQLNFLSISIAIVAGLLTIIYPLCKRITYFPQILLGWVFSGIPVLIGFAAVQNNITLTAIWASITASLWPLSYDTIYAMQDFEDDQRQGVKSLAVYLNGKILSLVIYVQLTFFSSFFIFAYIQNFTIWFFSGFFLAITAALKQLYLLQEKKLPINYQHIFRITHWQGAALTLGLILEKI